MKSVITLQLDLDIIHTSHIHNSLSINLSKYISEISSNSNENGKEEIIYDEFGIYFDYWKLIVKIFVNLNMQI